MKINSSKMLGFQFFCLYLQQTLKEYAMIQVTLLFIVVLVIVLFIVVSSYLHKRHVEYKMVDIEKAVQSAYTGGGSSVEKEVLVKAVKKYFHCSSKEAHYIIGVARRKKIVDIAAEKVTLHRTAK